MTRIKFEDILRASGVSDQFEMPQEHLDQALKMIRQKKRRRWPMLFIIGGLSLAVLFFVANPFFSSGEEVPSKIHENSPQKTEVAKLDVQRTSDRVVSANNTKRTAPLTDVEELNSIREEQPNTAQRQEKPVSDYSSNATIKTELLNDSSGVTHLANNMNARSPELASSAFSKVTNKEAWADVKSNNTSMGNTSEPTKTTVLAGNANDDKATREEIRTAQWLPGVAPDRLLSEDEDGATLPYNEVRIPAPPLAWSVVGQWGGYALADEVSSSAYVGLNMAKYWNRRWYSSIEGGVEVNYNLRENHSVEQVDNYGVEVVSTYYLVQPDFILSPRISLLTGIQHGRWELEAGPQFRFAPYSRGGVYLTEYVDGAIGSKSVLATGNLARNNTQSWTWGGEARWAYRLSVRQSLGISMIYQNETFFTKKDVLRQGSSILDLRVYYRYRF